MAPYYPSSLKTQYTLRYARSHARTSIVAYIYWKLISSSDKSLHHPSRREIHPLNCQRHLSRPPCLLRIEWSRQHHHTVRGAYRQPKPPWHVSSLFRIKSAVSHIVRAEGPNPLPPSYSHPSQYLPTHHFYAKTQRPAIATRQFIGRVSCLDLSRPPATSNHLLRETSTGNALL